MLQLLRLSTSVSIGANGRGVTLACFRRVQRHADLSRGFAPASQPGPRKSRTSELREPIARGAAGGLSAGRPEAHARQGSVEGFLAAAGGLPQKKYRQLHSTDTFMIRFCPMCVRSVLCVVLT